MRWRALKSLHLGEVQERIAAYREKHVSLSLLHEEFTKGRMPPGRFQEYVDWTSMTHAVRAYQEGEDFEYLAEEDLSLTVEDFRKLTPRRLELLDQLTEGRAGSINELAERAGRDVKNVYRDLKALEEMGFVALNREGRSMVPELLVYEITLILD
jgi:predicted transcriptional regulator